MGDTFSVPFILSWYKPITLQIYDLELNVRKVKTDKIPLCVFGSLNWVSYSGLWVDYCAYFDRCLDLFKTVRILILYQLETVYAIFRCMYVFFFIIIFIIIIFGLFNVPRFRGFRELEMPLFKGLEQRIRDRRMTVVFCVWLHGFFFNFLKNFTDTNS